MLRFHHIRKPSSVVVTALLLGGACVGALNISRPAFAQRAYRSDLVGQWKSNLQDHYLLRSNGTYTFTIGDPQMTNHSHSGTWSVVNGHTLRLHASRRTAWQGGRLRTLSTNKTFRLDLEMPNDHTITLDGARFYRLSMGRI